MAPALLLLGLVGVGVGVVAASGGDIAARQRRDRARAIRQAADRQLFRGWLAIAQDPWNDPVLRRAAWSAASVLKRYWLDSGHSGRRLPRTLSRKIYGNWCGPGYGSGVCLDEIDCACRTHDRAYDYAAAVEDGLI